MLGSGKDGQAKYEFQQVKNGQQNISAIRLDRLSKSRESLDGTLVRCELHFGLGGGLRRVGDQGHKACEEAEHRGQR